MNTIHLVDLLIIGLYFAAMAAMGAWWARRTRTTESYFVGNRSYAGWVVGVSLFGAQISSITFVAYPADAFKTAWLRYVICLTLPISVWVAARFLLPVFRKHQVTSLFEFLEMRFGSGVRVYGASVFMLSQCIRISLIQYLVALLMHTLTGWNVPFCILLGGVVTAYYTIVGGLEAVIWTDVVQSVLLTGGGLLILGTIIWKLPGGFDQLLSIAWADGKFLVGELGTDGRIHSIPWGLALTHKTVIMLLVVGAVQWLTDYTTNQEVVQRYCAARSQRDADRAIWLCCWTCLPTWGYFMLVGTGLYVFYKVFPDPHAGEMLSGARKAEEILPFYVTNQLGPGVTGLVIAAVLAAAMSSMSSAMNSIAAVFVTDLYRRHWVPNQPELHYVRAAKMVTLASSVVMVGGAWLLFHAQTMTLQHLWTEFQSIVAGGLLGLFLLGFVSKKTSSCAAAIGIGGAVLFSACVSAVELGWFPPDWSQAWNAHFDSYYTGIVGNLLTFSVGLGIGWCKSRLKP
jgi:SSS family solute:Na+ symporter